MAALAALNAGAAAQTPAERPPGVPQDVVPGRPMPVPKVEVKGVVFLSEAGQVLAAGWPALAVPGVDATRVPALNNPDFKAQVAPFMGRDVEDVLSRLPALVSAYFKAIGRPFVSVGVPRQALGNGVVQILVIEGRLGTLSVAGNAWFDSAQYLDRIRLRPGDPIDTHALDAGVEAINRNPYRHVQIVAAPGTATGTTDLALRAQERFPLSFNFGADNTGNAATGRTRLSAGFEWGNALWLGDDFTYNYTTSTDIERLQQHAASYTHYISALDTLSVSASNAVSRGDPGALFSTTGVSSAANLRYSHTLSADPAFRQDLTVGFDYKRANNDLLFGGTSVFPTSTDVDQFVATYSANLPDSAGSTSANVSAVFSPGGMTGANTDSTFDTQRGGATAQYFYLRLQADRLTNLPHGMTWYLHAVGQISASNLLPSEDLVFGGFQALRGFDEQTAVRDNGLVLTNELRSPYWSTGLAALAGAAGEKDRLMVYGFLDVGVGENHDDLGGQDSSLTMVSVGPGLTYQFGDHVALRLVTGFVLTHDGATADSPNRTHLGLQVNF